MSQKQAHISVPKIDQKKRSIFDAISKMAFWSHEPLVSSQVSDDKLIEKVLMHGDDHLRRDLLDVFSIDQIRNIWEQKLVIQEPRLHNLNLKIASSLLHIKDPENHIQQSYKKYNLYDRFSS